MKKVIDMHTHQCYNKDIPMKEVKKYGYATN